MTDSVTVDRINDKVIIGLYKAGFVYNNLIDIILSFIQPPDDYIPKRYIIIIGPKSDNSIFEHKSKYDQEYMYTLHNAAISFKIMPQDFKDYEWIESLSELSIMPKQLATCIDIYSDFRIKKVNPTLYNIKKIFKCQIHEDEYTRDENITYDLVFDSNNISTFCVENYASIFSYCY